MRTFGAMRPTTLCSICGQIASEYRYTPPTGHAGIIKFLWVAHDACNLVTSVVASMCIVLAVAISVHPSRPHTTMTGSRPRFNGPTSELVLALGRCMKRAGSVQYGKDSEKVNGQQLLKHKDIMMELAALQPNLAFKKKTD